jgi:hypothetical protein
MSGSKWTYPAFLLALCALAGCNRGLGSDELARADEFRLEIEEAARLIAPVADLPNDATVVEAVVEFWTDYSLLAWAMNQEGEVGRIDLTRLVRPQIAMETMDRLQAAVVRVDSISDEDLRDRFEQDRPGEQVRARHVLLRFPEGATAAQRDSVRALAEQIRDRARGGADFGELARTYSGDLGSAAAGGDLGFFQRGDMVMAFEDAAFALQPGGVSDVVQSEFGLHVIKVDERNRPTFEDIAEEYRTQLRDESLSQAETVFVSQLEASANVQVETGAVQAARDVAAGLDDPMGGRDAGATLTTYEGGTFTAGELREFLMAQPRQLLQQIDMAPDEQVDGLLRSLTREELLMAEAARRGISVAAEEVEAFEAELRLQYGQAAEILGLASIQPSEGETLRDAVDRTVMEVMRRIVGGEQEAVPLGPLANPLREMYSTEASEAAIPLTVDQVAVLRSAGFTGEGVPDPSPSTSPTLPAPVPDSVGNEPQGGAGP